jgi:hypothetical protein
MDDRIETCTGVVRSREPVVQLTFSDDLLELPEQANSGSSQFKFPQFLFLSVFCMFPALILTH